MSVYINRNEHPLLTAAIMRMPWFEPSMGAPDYLYLPESVVSFRGAMEDYLYMRMGRDAIANQADNTTGNDRRRHDAIERDRLTRAGRIFGWLLAHPYEEFLPAWIAGTSARFLRRPLLWFLHTHRPAVVYTVVWNYFVERGDVVVSRLSGRLMATATAVRYIDSDATFCYLTDDERAAGLEHGTMVDCEVYREGETYRLCHKHYAEDHLYFYSCDDIYRENPPYDEDDDEPHDDDYVEEDENGLLDYHSNGTMRCEHVCGHLPMVDDPLKDDPLKLGFEAEVNIESRRRSCLEQLKQVIGEIGVCEHDGSLTPGQGFEFVTGWSTLGTVKSWARAYCDVVNSYDHNFEEAGLHITTSALSALHVARIMGFVFDASNRNLVRHVAGRDYNHFARDYSDIRTRYGAEIAKTQRTVAAHYVKHPRNHPRYQAINPRSRDDRYSNTIEWRMFKATVNPRSMQARLEFVWAVTKYCNPLRCETLTVTAFVHALINDHMMRRHTPCLRAYLTRTEGLREVYPTLAAAEEKAAARATKRLQRTVAAVL
jgi:hypothetical protein